jgi:sensor c-di-GMP phosphodiesterase-like protein
VKFFNRLTWLIVVGVVITTTLPILAAISIAERQSSEAEQANAADIAQRALARAEIIGDQLREASRDIRTLTAQDACTAKGLELMRTIDLRSTMLQGVGWVEGRTMRCSSFMGNDALALGSADFTSPSGAQFRVNMRLVDPDATYLAVQIGHAIGIVHRDLPLSYIDDDVPGLAVSLFAWSSRTPLNMRGKVPAELYTKPRGSGVFVYNGSLVAVAKSDIHDVAALAVLPPGHRSNYALEAAKILIPIGLLIGLILSALLVYVVRNRLSMPAMIRAALAQRKFHLHYQPVVELATGRIVGAEALIRWDRGDAGDIPTERFIDAAEEAGLIPLITGRVFELLAEDARAVLALMPDFRFSVNLAASDLYRPSILGEVERLTERSGLGARNLVIEATERSLVDVDRARETMDRLREMGVRLAIDDFGTGYSSLAYLAQIEADFLKIDRLFVQALGTESATSQVAERIIEMGKDLSLEIVAEGIETKRQERLVRRLGVECAQGFLYGQAMAVDDLLVRLRADRAKPVRRKLKAAA